MTNMLQNRKTDGANTDPCEDQRQYSVHKTIIHHRLHLGHDYIKAGHPCIYLEHIGHIVRMSFFYAEIDCLNPDISMLCP